ncbi:MAG: DUF86 domain-containing protein [Chloroflexi bacterium]|nr:DUF86 domain-containing protein [Chloroflexota bacterium]
MKRHPRLYLEDILKSIDIIQDHTKGITEEGFYGSMLIQDAVVRRLEIIGEAAKHVPARLRAKEPSIPWQDIAGMRNRLAHEYFGIQLHRAW